MNKNEIMVELPNGEPGQLRELAEIVSSLARMMDPEAAVWVSFPPPEDEILPWETAFEIELTGRFMGRHYAPPSHTR